MQSPTTIWCDNAGTVNIANDAGSVGRSRHLAMRARFLQDFKAAGEGKICYVKTEDNAADALTKPLERGRFSKHRSYLLGRWWTSSRLLESENSMLRQMCMQRSRRSLEMVNLMQLLKSRTGR